MGNYVYQAKTLDDESIRDGLSSVATLTNHSKYGELYFVVGGIATQSYLPSQCRRPTADIDLAILMPLNREEFNKISEPVADNLASEGYNISVKKARRAFCLEYSGDNGTNFISFPRHNQHSFENLEDILFREIKNSRTKIVEERIDSYVVASPEDIIIRKLSRAVNRLDRNSKFERYVASMSGLNLEQVKAKLKEMEDMRINLEREYNPEEAERLRFLSDLHDIRLLSEIAGMNKAYFSEAIEDWKALTEHSNERDMIIRSVLPNRLMPEHI